MYSYFETRGKYLLFTKYLTSTKQKKDTKKILVSHCPDKRGSIVCHLNQFDCAIS